MDENCVYVVLALATVLATLSQVVKRCQDRGLGRRRKP